MPRLAALSREFERLYALNGRPSIAPEKLLRALLLQAFYSVRSERQLMEQLDYNLLFRWFVGLGIDEPVWDVTVFTKNRERLLEGAIAAKFLRAVLAQPKVEALLSDEHFSVDGTLIEAWASMKSLSAEGRQRRAAGTRAATASATSMASSAATTRTPRPPIPTRGCTARARARRPSSASWATLLMENRNGLIVDGRVSEATGTAERDAGRDDAGGRAGPASGSPSVATRTSTRRASSRRCASSRSTPHVAQNTSNRRSAIDGRTTRHPGYAVSQRIRKRIEEASAGSRRSPCNGVPASRQGACRLAVHPGGRGLQPDPAAKLLAG